jgi:hypothetical protein
MEFAFSSAIDPVSLLYVICGDAEVMIRGNIALFEMFDQLHWTNCRLIGRSTCKKPVNLPFRKGSKRSGLQGSDGYRADFDTVNFPDFVSEMAEYPPYFSIFALDEHESASHLPL